MFSALGSIKSSIAGFLPETVDPAAGQKSFYELKAPLPGNKEYDFADLKGKVVLIVNTASKCGFTYQFTGLEELNKEYGDRGLTVLGFPSNEFAGQDPGTDADIESFCQVNHGVTFKLMKKSEVNGSSMNEVFAWLKTQKSADGTESFAGPIKWNFNKFLVNREGQVVGRYGSSTKPEAMKADIEKLL